METKPMQANYPIHPDLPSWSLSSTHSQLHDQFEATLIILEIYERTLDSLCKEYEAVKDESKAAEIGMASLDVRAAFPQLAALAATFCQKSKGSMQNKFSVKVGILAQGGGGGSDPIPTFFQN